MVDGIDDEGILLPVTCYCAKSAAAGAGDVDAADAGNVADLAIGNRLPEVLYKKKKKKTRKILFAFFKLLSWLQTASHDKGYGKMEKNDSILDAIKVVR